MKKINSNETMYVRKIPLINYLLILIMFLAVVLISIYVCAWYQYRKENGKKQSYLVQHNFVSNQVKSIQELKQVISESPNKLLVYITYHSNKTYKIEKKLVTKLNDYDIDNNFYVFDVTIQNEKTSKFIDVLNDSLDINVTGFPVIIYYEDGQIVSYKKISSYKEIINILDKYDFDKFEF